MSVSSVFISLTQPELPLRQNLEPGTFFVYECRPTELRQVPSRFGWIQNMTNRDILLSNSTLPDIDGTPEEWLPDLSVIVLDVTAQRAT